MTRSSRPGIPPVALIFCYVVLTVLPIGLAGVRGLPTRGFVVEFSSGLAMAGLVMVLAQFLTSGRFELTTGRAGIDLTMRAHQLAARFVIALLVVHPFLYALPAARADLSSAASAAAGLFVAPRLLSGVIAWGLLLVLIVTAVLRDRLPARYEVWRVLHGFGALAVAGLGVHHALTAGRYAGDDAALTVLWIVLFVAACASLAYVYVLTPLAQLRRPWRIATARRIGDRLWELVLEPAAQFTQRLTAGQFFWLTLDRSPFSIVEHPFSTTSSSAELPRLSFLIKESGDFTGRFASLRLGARAYVQGPCGNFTLAGRRGSGIGLIAGGVGFAPILGLLRQLRADRDKRPIRLLVGNRHQGQLAYGGEVAAMTQVLDLQVRHVLSEPPTKWEGGRGVITRAELEQVFNAANRGAWLYFVCGPPAMMDAVERDLIGMGVPRSAIVTERFRY